MMALVALIVYLLLLTLRLGIEDGDWSWFTFMVVSMIILYIFGKTS